MGFPTNIVSNSVQDTFALGQKISNYLFPSSVVALAGTLGSGKTQLTKGIACGLGITENITSPTYTIINEYTRENLPTLYHIDVYRLENSKDFEDLGGMEIIYSNGICIIEWSERIIKILPDDTIKISLKITGVSSRLIQITGLDTI
ncbi:MAG: tRNA (adenosine(37)-N6)-threonylcarbamoyltransferase complex ATPase subunit type 1 TsaE [Treponema sp.]|nr:tRNA (adenosine(37)-N6)-threonylcarbamoyltransferase complex ATPase subunit type 1 TsaE [Treponema sp.]